MCRLTCWRRILCLSVFGVLLYGQAVLSSVSTASSRNGASQPGQTQPATPQTAAILAEARRILAGLQVTTYAHKTHVDETIGEYDMDCSGLCRYILRRILPGHLAVVVEAGKRAAPRAAEFCDFFQARQIDGRQDTGWTTVARLMDARGGDMIAWRREKFIPHESTGHMMIVAEPPQAEANDVVRVRVIDSSTAAVEGSTQPAKANGVSLRTRRFRVDAQGAATEYLDNQLHSRGGAIAVGRAIAPPTPAK